MKILKWLYDTSDKIDIYCTKTFNKRPKQKALELKMDLKPNPNVTRAIDEALGLREITFHQYEVAAAKVIGKRK